MVQTYAARRYAATEQGAAYVVKMTLPSIMV